MGHTVTSQRRVIQRLVKELQQYKHTLDPEEREILERLLKRPLQRVGCISGANSLHVWAFVLLTIIIEQEQNIGRLATGSTPEQELHRPVVEAQMRLSD